jgi:hypothetical protein
MAVKATLDRRAGGRFGRTGIRALQDVVARCRTRAPASARARLADHDVRPSETHVSRLTNESWRRIRTCDSRSSYFGALTPELATCLTPPFARTRARNAHRRSQREATRTAGPGGISSTSALRKLCQPALPASPTRARPREPKKATRLLRPDRSAPSSAPRPNKKGLLGIAPEGLFRHECRAFRAIRSPGRTRRCVV